MRKSIDRKFRLSTIPPVDGDQLKEVSLRDWLKGWGQGQAQPLELASTPGAPVAGVRAAVILLEPRMAEDLLSRRGEGQREKTRIGIEQYVSDIAAGDWSFHHQGILVDQRMALFDGQNRCYAVRKAGKSIWTIIVQIPGANMGLDIDRGTKRSPAFVASAQTSAPITPREVAILRGIRDTFEPSRAYIAPTPAENKSLFETWGAAIRSGPLRILAQDKQVNVPAPVISALAFAAAAGAGDRVNRFAELYGRLSIPESPHPLRALLDYLRADRHSSVQVIRATLNALHAYETGQGLNAVSDDESGWAHYTAATAAAPSSPRAV